jgi:hypothetical protein
MSADAWRVCPQCKDKLYKKLKSSYGKIPEEEYVLLLKQKEDLQDESNTATLREDYEIYTDEEGLFSVSYGCSCDKCGFKFEYNYSKLLIKG